MDDAQSEAIHEAGSMKKCLNARGRWGITGPTCFFKIVYSSFPCLVQQVIASLSSSGVIWASLLSSWSDARKDPQNLFSFSSEPPQCNRR